MRRAIVYALAAVLIGGAMLGCSKVKKPKSSVASYGWFADLREEIVTTVQDPYRAQQMLLIASDIEALVFALADKSESVGIEFEKLNIDYKTPRADFETLFQQYESDMKTFTEALWAARDDMKSIVTQEEWTAIADEQDAFYEKWSPTLY